MYNFYLAEKQRKHQQQLGRLSQDIVKFKKHKNALNEHLAKNYSKRVQTFIINSLQNPIIVNHYSQNKPHSFREESRSMMLGDPNIYVKGFKHEKDRIAEAIRRNSNLDQHPNTHIYAHCFRERDISKQRLLHPDDMRFKAKTSLERVQQYLKYNTQAQLQNLSYQGEQMGKSLLPSLHRKSHFNAITEVYLNTKLGSSVNRSAPLLAGLTGTIDQIETPTPRVSQTHHSFQNFDPVITSKQVLQKSMVMAMANPKVPVIKKGEGHTCAHPDLMNKDVQIKVKLKKIKRKVKNDKLI